MEVSRINCKVPFRAVVQDKSPLVNGNWQFVEDTAAKTDSKKKGGFWKKALVTAAALIIAGYALHKARGTEAIKDIVSKTFKESEGFWSKTKWVFGKAVDKGGEYAELAYSKTIAPLWNGIKKLFGKNAEKAAAEGAEAASAVAGSAGEAAATAASSAAATAGEAAATAASAAAGNVGEAAAGAAGKFVEVAESAVAL